MKANVFRNVNEFGIEEVERPRAGAGDAIIRVTLTTICGTDSTSCGASTRSSLAGSIGHEPVGVIEELGPGVTGYEVGDRVLVGAITPCGQCHRVPLGPPLAVRPRRRIQGDRWMALGNTIHGTQAEYVRIPNAQANLAKIPES